MRSAQQTTLMVLTATAMILGCTDAPAKGEDSGAVPNKAVPAPPAAVKANTGGGSATQDAPKRELTESDILSLETAGKSCERRDFRTFFDSFIRSPAVRDRYTAATITMTTKGSTRRVARDRYFDFPIALRDYTYIAKSSEGAGPNESEYLRLNFNTANDNRQRIDWVRVRYAGNGNDGDGTAKIEGTIGLPGYLLFNPTKECWELIQDTVYEGPFEGDLN